MLCEKAVQRGVTEVLHEREVRWSCFALVHTHACVGMNVWMREHAQHTNRANKLVLDRAHAFPHKVRRNAVQLDLLDYHPASSSIRLANCPESSTPKRIKNFHLLHLIDPPSSLEPYADGSTLVTVVIRLKTVQPKPPKSRCLRATLEVPDVPIPVESNVGAILESVWVTSCQRNQLHIAARG